MGYEWQLKIMILAQSEYPVLHYETFGGTGQYRKKGSGPIMSNFLGGFFVFWGAKEILKNFLKILKSCIN